MHFKRDQFFLNIAYEKTFLSIYWKMFSLPHRLLAQTYFHRTLLKQKLCSLKSRAWNRIKVGLLIGLWYYWGMDYCPHSILNSCLNSMLSLGYFQKPLGKLLPTDNRVVKFWADLEKSLGKIQSAPIAI